MDLHIGFAQVILILLAVAVIFILGDNFGWKNRDRRAKEELEESNKRSSDYRERLIEGGLLVDGKD